MMMYTTTHRPSRPVSLRFAVAVLAGVVALTRVSPARAEPEDQPMRIGFTRSIFRNRNENDVLAAMQVWAQTIGKERNIALRPRMEIYRTLEEASSAVQSSSVDALTLSLLDYSALPDGLLSGPFFRDETAGSIHRKYVLLARRGGTLGRIEQLRGARLAVLDELGSTLAMRWLNAQCAQAGLERIRELVASVERCQALSKTVLSVFFGKNDACLVTEAGFQSMAELNPQVAQKLVVLVTSPAVLPSVFAFRASLSKDRKAELFREVLRLDETVTGAQVLRVFKSDRMAEATAEDVENTVKLIRAWDKAFQDGAPSFGSREGGDQ
jgi:hypothetical protein